VGTGFLFDKIGASPCSFAWYKSSSSEPAGEESIYRKETNISTVRRQYVLLGPVPEVPCSAVSCYILALTSVSWSFERWCSPRLLSLALHITSYRVALGHLGFHVVRCFFFRFQHIPRVLSRNHRAWPQGSRIISVCSELFSTINFCVRFLFFSPATSEHWFRQPSVDSPEYPSKMSATERTSTVILREPEGTLTLFDPFNPCHNQSLPNQHHFVSCYVPLLLPLAVRLSRWELTEQFFALIQRISYNRYSSKG
jgi:hypothetical protein